MFVNSMYFCLLCAFYVSVYYIMYIVICAYICCWTKFNTYIQWKNKNMLWVFMRI